MEKFIRLLFLSLIFFSGFCLLEATEFSADFFLYSQDDNYLYGAGNVVIKNNHKVIIGQTLFLDIKSLEGRIMGGVEIKDENSKSTLFDELVFSLLPFRYLGKIFSSKIIITGDTSLESRVRILKLNQLQKSSIYFEFNKFEIKPDKKIIAQNIIPYIMGVPSLPLKKFAIKKGDFSKRTALYLKKIDYTRQYGLSLNLGLNIYQKILKGNHNFKLFERELFNFSGPKRGLIIEGTESFFIKDKEFLRIYSLGNTDDQSFSLNFSHNNETKSFSYSINHNISGRSGEASFHLLNSSISYKKLKHLTPQFDFTYDYQKSYTYKISSPVKIHKDLRLNIGWERNIVKNALKRDDSRFFSSLGFTSSIISLSSNLDITQDLIKLSTRKAFSVNFNIPSIEFLEKNIRFIISPFYTFSSIPTGEYLQNTSTPGLNFSILSLGTKLPLGFKLIPNFTLYHLWNAGDDNKTIFNTLLSLHKTINNFTFSLDYSLVSRFSSKSLWVEGYNMNNLNLRLEIKKDHLYSLSSRFYFNDDFSLENITFLGKVSLPLKSHLSTSLIYYYLEKRLATFEIYLEKDFIGLFKLRGGYSLALKRFFIDFVQYL